MHLFEDYYRSGFRRDYKAVLGCSNGNYFDLPIGNKRYKLPEFHFNNETQANVSPERFKLLHGVGPGVQINTALFDNIGGIPFVFLCCVYCEGLIGQILHSMFKQAECIAPDGQPITILNYGTVFNPNPVLVLSLHDRILSDYSSGFEAGYLELVFSEIAKIIIGDFVNPAVHLEIWHQDTKKIKEDIAAHLESLEHIQETVFELRRLNPSDLKEAPETIYDLKSFFLDNIKKMESHPDHLMRAGLGRFPQEQKDRIVSAFWSETKTAIDYLHSLPTKDG